MRTIESKLDEILSLVDEEMLKEECVFVLSIDNYRAGLKYRGYNCLYNYEMPFDSMVLCKWKDYKETI